jgi:hypothetical protein
MVVNVTIALEFSYRRITRDYFEVVFWKFPFPLLRLFILHREMILIRTMLRDIRFWIVVFFILRLVGITNPPLETGHNWRQSLTCMIARNFLEIDNTILYPRIDMAGEKTGIIGSEFPFFNYLIYLISELFGYEHWYGRLINLSVSSLGVWYFYRLAKEYFSREIAFNASLVLLSSIWFAFSRKIMPDTFSIALLIAGIHHGNCFLRYERHRLIHAMMFFTLCTLGMLVKIPALSLFAGIGIALFVPEISMKRKMIFFGLAGLSLASVFSWYFIWVPHLLEAYRFQLYFPKGLLEGAGEILPLLDLLAEKFYFAALHSYFAFAFALWGLFRFCKFESIRYIGAFLGITCVFALFVLKTGSVFPLHNYYVIPFVPLMALMAAYGMDKLKNTYRIACIVLICVEGIANQQHDFFIRPDQAYKTELEDLLDRTIEEKGKIIINGGQSPQDMYFAHRRGWSIEPDRMANKAYIDSLISMGARYAVVDLKHGNFPMHKQIGENTHYRIFDLYR